MLRSAVNKFAEEAAGLIFDVLDTPTLEGSPLSRIFTYIGVNDELKNAVKDNIMASAYHQQEKKDAAVVLFDLYDTMPYRRDYADARNDLIRSLQNNKLTIACR
jgi:hypothetical protein